MNEKIEEGKKNSKRHTHRDPKAQESKREQTVKAKGDGKSNRALCNRIS